MNRKEVVGNKIREMGWGQLMNALVCYTKEFVLGEWGTKGF